MLGVKHNLRRFRIKKQKPLSNFNHILDPFSASSAKPQHLMEFYHQSSKQEREKQSSMKRMLEKQITVESSQIESQDNPIDLTGSSLIAPESCISHYVTENVINKKKFRDTIEKSGNSSDLLKKTGNSSNENFLPEDLERVNEVSKQKGRISKQQTRIEGVENFRRKRAPTSKKGFKCWKCRNGFKNESELNIHMQNPCEPIHSNSNLGQPNQYKDGECSEEFSHAWMVKEYLEVHWEVGPFQCEHCDLAFKREKNLTSHMKKYHESEMEAYFSKQESKKEFECRICRKGFTNESELNIHMQNPCEPKHGKLNIGKPNQYKCGGCSEEFSHEWKLKEHLVVHWEEKPFECEYCDLAFKWKNHLTSHMNKYHESEMEAYFSMQEAKREFKCGNVQESLQTNRNYTIIRSKIVASRIPANDK